MAPPAGKDPGPSLLSPTDRAHDGQPKLSKHSVHLTSQNPDSHPTARDSFYLQVTDGKRRLAERVKLAQCIMERVTEPGWPPGLIHLFLGQATTTAPDTPGTSALETLLLSSLTHWGVSCPDLSKPHRKGADSCCPPAQHSNALLKWQQPNFLWGNLGTI